MVRNTLIFYGLCGAISFAHVASARGVRLQGHPYEGPRYAALFWEHNFRTVPFEYLGLWGFVRRGMGLIVHGASGHTWGDGASSTMRSTHGWHHELGASLILYGIFRFDVTRRVDRAGWRLIDGGEGDS